MIQPINQLDLPPAEDKAPFILVLLEFGGGTKLVPENRLRDALEPNEPAHDAGTSN